MCNESEKLVAWMDGELAENEAADVERHVRDCSECRSRVNAYGELSRLVVSYCDAANKSARRKLPRWVPALGGAVAAAAVLLLLLRPHPVSQTPIVARAAAPVPEVISQTLAAPQVKVKAKAIHRRHADARDRNANADWAFANPDIQIVIPAEAMFPPGAAPEGAVFRADLSMASDGSVQGLRLLQ